MRYARWGDGLAPPWPSHSTRRLIFLLKCKSDSDLSAMDLLASDSQVIEFPTFQLVDSTPIPLVLGSNEKWGTENT